MNPIWIEDLHQKPDIWIYHDVTSVKERQTIVELAGPLVSFLRGLLFFTVVVQMRLLD